MTTDKRNFEDILDVIGRFGIYHRIVLSVTMTLGVIQSMVFLCNVMLTDGIHKYLCRVDERVQYHVETSCNQSWTENQDYRAKPMENMTSSQCQKFVLDPVIDPVNCSFWFSDRPNSTQEMLAGDLNVTECTSWKYTGSAFRSSVGMKFNLVCQSAWKSHLSSLSLMGGLLIGSIIFGQLSDKFGRKPTLVLCSVLISVSGFTSTVVGSYAVYCGIQLLTGAAFIGAATTGYITIMELISEKHRVVVGQIMQCSFSISQMLLAFVGFLIPDWRIVGKATSALVLPPSLIFLKFGIESPRWLYAEGRIDEGDRMVKKLAKSNKTYDELTVFMQQQTTLAPKCEETISSNVNREDIIVFTDIFKHWTLLKFTLILSYSWFASSCVFYGLSFSASLLGGNVFINLFFCGLVEMPANVIGAFLMNAWGRRPSICLLYFLLSASLVCMTFVESCFELKLTLFLLGKLSCTGTFSCIYLYTTELYPTPIRGIGVGLCSGCSRIGGLSAIAIMMLASVSPMLPFLIFGVVGFVAGILICLVPETKNSDYPDTIEECKSMDKQRKSTIFSQCLPCVF